jgi:hypothetical protein
MVPMVKTADSNAVDHEANHYRYGAVQNSRVNIATERFPGMLKKAGFGIQQRRQKRLLRQGCRV